MISRKLAVLASVTAFGFAGLSAPAGAAHSVLTADLTGAAERPGPGDPDGTGVATVVVSQARNRVCVVLQVADIQPASAAHIHRAPADRPGPVVVHLAPPTRGHSYTCANVDGHLADALVHTPWLYYVNVHNTQYPGGAVRGQLH